MSALSDIVRSNERDSTTSTANAVAAAIGLSEELTELLRPALVQYCRMVLRGDARFRERNFRRPERRPHDRPIPPPTSVEPPTSPIGVRTRSANPRQDALRRAAHDRFSTYRGVSVLWLDATAEDHQYRITMMEKAIAGSRKTIRYHEKSLRRIRAAGVSCLRDIPDLDLAEIFDDEEDDKP